MNTTQEKLIFYTVFKDLDPSSGFKMPQKKFFLEQMAFVLFN